jgi:ornithine cyclodeaminase
VRPINEIWAFDQNKNNLEYFAGEFRLKHPEIRVNLTKDSGEVARNSEIVISATNSPRPVFENSKELFTGKTFVGIGSYKPDCREFPEWLFRQLDQVFVDTIDGKSESGDLITPLENGWISEGIIHSLGSLISGHTALSSNKTNLFKTVGSAIFDLVAAKLVYEKYLKKPH